MGVVFTVVVMFVAVGEAAFHQQIFVRQQAVGGTVVEQAGCPWSLQQDAVAELAHHAEVVGRGDHGETGLLAQEIDQVGR